MTVCSAHISLHAYWHLQLYICLWVCVCAHLCSLIINLPPAPSDTCSPKSFYTCSGIWIRLNQLLHWTQTETLGGKVLTDVNGGSHYWWLGSSMNAIRRLQENKNWGIRGRRKHKCVIECLRWCWRMCDGLCWLLKVTEGSSLIGWSSPVTPPGFYTMKDAGRNDGIALTWDWIHKAHQRIDHSRLWMWPTCTRSPSEC